jgi:predicted nucleic acid-binding protein
VVNGRTKRRIVFDSNSIIDIANDVGGREKVAELVKTHRFFVSVITRIEAMVSPRSVEEEAYIRLFLKRCKVIPLNRKVEQEAVKLRRAGSPRPKLPDAIVAATAAVMDAVLVTRDDGLLRLSWPGLQTMNIL